MHTTQEARLGTFEGRTDIFPIETVKLAAAGFCWTPFTNSPASVRCEDCELVIKDVVEQADPIIAHRRARPDCTFVKSFDTMKSAEAGKTMNKAPNVIKILDTVKPAVAVVTAPEITKAPETINLTVPSKTLSGAADSFKPGVADLTASKTVKAPKTVNFVVPEKAIAVAEDNVKPAAAAKGGVDTKRVEHQNVDNDILIDISDPEPAMPQTVQIFELSEKHPAGPKSETIMDLMDIFAVSPSKIATVKNIVGALANRTIHEDLVEIAKGVPRNATTRPIPDDLRTCRHCKATFEDRDKLFQHVYTKCGKNPEACPNPFPCRVCRKSFSTRKELRRHLGDAHNIALWF
jgi:hypothetical protein